jgi:hypothetical protein
MGALRVSWRPNVLGAGHHRFATEQHAGVIVQLKAGQRLRSQVCASEVIVVRAPKSAIELECGGKPMVDISEPVTEHAAPAPGLDTGTLIGKRYTSPGDDALEVLVTKPGAGTLAAQGTPLVFMATKPLPSSD